NLDGSFTYTPNEDFVGRDSFTYVNRAGGATSNIATVTLDVGNLAPSSISGYVYSDTDNDGVMDPVEARYGGVQVTLKGTDLLGRAVSLTTRSAANGSYSFTDVLSGRYTVTEFQPRFLVDGKDTHNGELSLRNDRFIVNLGAGVAETNYNFGERGLMPQYIMNPMFFSSRTSHGLLAAYDGAGEMEWYCVDTGWTNLATVDSTLHNSMGMVEVSISDGNGGTDSANIAVAGNRNARLTGSASDGYLFKLTGDPSDFGLVPVGGESELDASAVDAAFATKRA
ncbi:MAG: hypothetical protein KDA92_03210, partial [Planctomycetales bacterium]|nr:hypothetical protein [Planctomycetales bacterium]